MPQQDDAQIFDLRVSADLMNADEKRPDATVYAYSAGGQLLTSEPLDTQGAASLKLPLSSEPTSVRVLVGPTLKSPSLDELLRRGSQERHLRLDSSQRSDSLQFSVLPARWHCWILGACAVRGTLLKRVTSGGLSQDLPVCHARVEIFEVDPFWLILSKLPDDVFGRLRDVILRPRPFPDPPPEVITNDIPLPSPGPDPSLLDSSRVHLDEGAAAALEKISQSTELRYLAQTGSRLQFERALVANVGIIRPLLCYLYPRFVSMQKVGEAWTDDCGHFQTIFFTGCNNPDVPDLYFKAYQRIFGFFEVTIYAPTPIACHTWWDYVCGSEVTLRTTSPLAITCSPCPPVIASENWVLFMGIGRRSLWDLRGVGAPVASGGSDKGLTTAGEPWGGELRPRIEFDNRLREVLGVRYYQLSFRRVGAPASTSWTPMTGDVWRHYAHMVGSDLVVSQYPLGPRVVSGVPNLFEIPPAVPPVGQWSLPDPVFDTTSGVFPTNTYSSGVSYGADGSELGIDGSGKFEIKVDLFDAAGSPVNIAALNIKFVVPNTMDLTGTIHTTNAASLGLVSGNSMIVTVHVDNNRCQAAIAPPTIGAATADRCCGVLKYTGTGGLVNLAWTARHRHGFATFNFNVIRGVSTVFSQSGPVGGGSHAASRSVNALLNDNLPEGCATGGCPVAGFGEHLHVDSLATNGWSNELGYDANAARAFVLAPQ